VIHPIADGRGWYELRRPARDRTPRPCLFIDRDGCIVVETGHLHRVADMVMIPGAAAVIAAANAAGWFVVEITNQSGVGQGLFTWDDFMAVQDAIHTAVAAEGGTIDMVLAAPWHPTRGLAPWSGDHPWRKPQPGMLLAAAEALPIDLPRSWIAGDRANDLAAGRAAGLLGGVLVATGHGAGDHDEAETLATPSFTVRQAPSLADVAGFGLWTTG
jgi:D-glycero-D-manno-heptose 1,7-bisphosphate phosphatase